MMNCEKAVAMLIDASQENDETLSEELQKHLDGCESCQQEAKELNMLFFEMDKVNFIQPKASSRERFQTMLYTEMNQQLVTGKTEQAAKKVFYMSWPLQLAAACVVLLMGIGIGTLLNQNKQANTPDDLVKLKNEVREMKEAALFSQLNNQSAGMRIQAINNVQEMTSPDQNLLTALEKALYGDKNANVRMAAVYALSNFADIKDVRDVMVKSLSKEKEPVIQIMLINLLTEKKETKAIGALKEMLKDNNTPKEVQDIAKKSIKSL